MANLYNLLRCSDNQYRVGYTNNSTVTVGQVFNDGSGACYRVQSASGTGTAPAGALQLEGLASYNNCSTCTNPAGTSGGGGGGQTTYYFSTLRPCGSVSSAATFQVYRDNADLTIGSSAKDPFGTCHEVISTEGSGTTIPQGAVNATAFTKYQDCNNCINPPSTTTGGGSQNTTQPATQTFYYRIRACSTPNGALINARRTSQFADLATGTAIKNGNVCFTVVEFVASPANTTPFQFDVTSAIPFATCALCQAPPPPPAGQRIQMVLKNCSAGGVQVVQAYKTMPSTFTYGSQNGIPASGATSGDVYKIGNQCYYVDSAIWAQGNTGTGTDVTSQFGSTYIGCQACTSTINYNNLNNLGNTGTVGTAITLSTGYRCSQQGCQTQLYNEAAGEEPQYFTLQECQSNCFTQNQTAQGNTQPALLQTGFVCTGGSCQEILYDPDTGLEPYPTLAACVTACAGYPVNPPPPPPGMTGYNCVNGQCSPTTGQAQYQTLADCQEAGCTIISDPPDTPDNPPPPPPPDPCDPIFEPREGQLLRSVTPVVTGGREGSAPGASLDPDSYEYLIEECWRWKYKVCSKRPPNSPPGTPWRMEVCLRNLSEPPDWPYPMPGTLYGFECRAKEGDITSNAPKYEKYAVYHDGYGGTYSMFIETNSVYCGYTPTPGCPSTGILVKTYCVGVDQYGEYHDGKCGKYTEKIAINSKICGYKDPPPPPPPPREDRTVEEIPTLTQVQPTKTGPSVNVGVYVPISVTDKMDTVDVTSNALWSGNNSFIRSQNTSSLSDSSSMSYILSVYDKPMTSPTCSSEIQYKIIYADYEGKGAKDLGGLDNETLTKAMYSQYAQILLPHGQTKFNFNGVDEDYVYIIDISRSRFKQSLDPGNWQLTLGASNFSFDFNKDSILSDMFTASYGNDSLTLIDDATKVNDNTGPIYITSKTYDVKIGTIEDGLYTTYVTASAASASIARQDVTHVTFPSSPLSNTAIVRGQERIPFVWSNFTSSITASRLYANYYNPAEGVSFFVEDKLTPNRVFNPNFPYEADNRVYKGSWTGSFTMPLGYGTFTPTIMSGAFFPEFDNTVANPTVMYDGYTWIAMNVKYTTGSKVYNGYLKFALYDVQNQIGAPGYFEPLYCPTCTEPSWSAIPGQDPITASLSQAAFGEFRADSWYNLKDELISTSSYTILSNGNILYPITSDSFGKVYPNHGIIVLSGRKLDALGFSTNRSIDRNGYNTYRLFHSMNLVLNQKLTDSSGDPLGFYGRSVDIKHTTRCFITLKNGYLNYSNNPTYVTGSEGDISNPFLYSEKSYFTSIGLYNADKELLAIGKLSKPIMSSTSDESLFTVKVTY